MCYQLLENLMIEVLIGLCACLFVGLGAIIAWIYED